MSIIFLFSSPQLSPIPYFPTNHQDLDSIIKALNLKNDQTIIDLGAGDGIVIFEAARIAKDKGLGTKFVAVDINPILIFIMCLRRLFHPNRKNIKIVWADLFKIKYNSLTRLPGDLSLEASAKGEALAKSGEPFNSLTFYLYVSPWLIEKIVSKIKKDIKDFNIVSYFYPVKSLNKKEKILKGKNQVYIYPSRMQ